MERPATAGARWALVCRPRACALPAAGAVLALYTFHAVGETFVQGWLLDLGSLVLPAPGPHTDPDLKSDILWVNHISVEEDRDLMETLPGRHGYVLQWHASCQPLLLPLEGLARDAVPDTPYSHRRQSRQP